MSLQTILAGALGALLAVLLAFGAGNYHGHQAERTAWEAKVEKQLADAYAEARADEQAKQAGVNNALRKQNDELAGINARLAADRDRLRQRPGRHTGVPAGSGAACAGATGANLSGPDAGFLVWEASRADRLRAALGACYAAYDAVSDKQKD